MSTSFAALLASADESSGGSILSLLFLPGLLVLLYFIMIRPQRRRMRQQAEAQASLQNSLQIGSEVITSSGIYGTVTGEDGDDVVWLEIDDDVQIRIARAAIQTIVDDSDDADDQDDTDDDVDAAESASAD
ncbi:MAG: preprotein translocase subunit YajC [Actinomycetota bacterium]